MDPRGNLAVVRGGLRVRLQQAEADLLQDIPLELGLASNDWGFQVAKYYVKLAFV